MTELTPDMVRDLADNPYQDSVYHEWRNNEPGVIQALAWARKEAGRQGLLKWREALHVQAT